jgi:hypothetical protein
VRYLEVGVRKNKQKECGKVEVVVERLEDRKLPTCELVLLLGRWIAPSFASLRRNTSKNHPK